LPKPSLTPTETNTRSKGHILIVEDWKPNVLVVSLALETLGYTFDIAPAGGVAVVMFRQHAYDALLMDIKLPDIDGYHVTQEIREIERLLKRRPLPIIATTAFATHEDREKCLAYGMNGYLAKPLELDTLGKLLAKLIR